MVDVEKDLIVKPFKIVQIMRKIERIFVHCTASSQKASVQSILAEFRRKGWRVPGYHWLIDKDGKMTQLVDESIVANGVKGYNSTSIHVAYIGGIDKQHPQGIDTRTPDQKAALEILLTQIHLRYPNAKIMGHRDISPDKNGNGKVDSWERIKNCPCFDAIPEYAHIQND